MKPVSGESGTHLNWRRSGAKGQDPVNKVSSIWFHWRCLVWKQSHGSNKYRKYSFVILCSTMLYSQSIVSRALQVMSGSCDLRPVANHNV